MVFDKLLFDQIQIALGVIAFLLLLYKIYRLSASKRPKVDYFFIVFVFVVVNLFVEVLEAIEPLHETIEDSVSWIHLLSSIFILAATWQRARKHKLA